MTKRIRAAEPCGGQDRTFARVKSERFSQLTKLGADAGRYALAGIDQNVNRSRLVAKVAERLVDEGARIRRTKCHNRLGNMTARPKVSGHRQLLVLREALTEAEKFLGDTTAKPIDRLVWIADHLYGDACSAKPVDDLKVGRIAVLRLVDN